MEQLPKLVEKVEEGQFLIMRRPHPLALVCLLGARFSFAARKVPERGRNLRSKCVACHAGDRAMGGWLRFAGCCHRKRRQRNIPIVPGDPAASESIARCDRQTSAVECLSARSRSRIRKLPSSSSGSRKEPPGRQKGSRPPHPPFIGHTSRCRGYRPAFDAVATETQSMVFSSRIGSREDSTESQSLQRDPDPARLVSPLGLPPTTDQ